MADFQIGIIGGTGGIGRWFADFFKSEGYLVHISGRHTGMAISEMAETCAVVIISVPIGTTCTVIEQVGPYMKNDSLLMDFTSLKVEPVRTMLRHSSSEVMGCHPLFGPNVTSLAGMNIVICPARISRWSSWPRTIFERSGAHIVEAAPEEHDEMMAIIQGFNHLNTIMMGLMLKDWGVDPHKLKNFATPIFNTKLEIIDKVIDNPRLYAEIISHNPYMDKNLHLWDKNLCELKRLVHTKDTEDLITLIQK